MRYRLLLSAAVAVMLLNQPIASATTIPTELFNVSSGSMDILASSNTSIDTEQDSNIFEWQKQFQKIQQATFQVLEPVLANDKIDNVKSNFESKLANLAATVNLSELQSGLTSNVVADTDNAQEESRNIAADTQDKAEGFQLWDIGNLVNNGGESSLDFQKWATDLSSNLGGNLQNLQDWGTDIVANLGDNLFSLSAELDEIEQEVENSTIPQESTEIQKIEQIAATLSAELNQIRQDLNAGSTSQELAEIQKAEQIADTLSAELNQVRQDVESEATPQELAEIQKAEDITAMVSEELNQMAKAAETTATLSEELNELQEVVEAYDEEVIPVTEEVAAVEAEPEVAQAEEEVAIPVTEEVAAVETEPEVAQAEEEAIPVVEEVAAVETEPEVAQAEEEAIPIVEEVAAVETEPEVSQVIEEEAVPVIEEVATVETESETVTATETIQTENSDELASLEMIQSEENFVPQEIAEINDKSTDADLQS